MRVHLLCEGSRGDIQPMIVLGESLAAFGHSAVLCGPPEGASLAAGREVAYRPVGESIRARLARDAGAIAGGSTRQFAKVAARFLREALPRQFESLREVTQDADFMIGAGVQLAGASLAELRGVPYRYVAYCPALIASAEHPAAGIANHTLPRFLNRLSWRGMRRLQNWLLHADLDRERRALGLAPVADVYEHVLGDAPVLAADPALAPLPGDARKAVEAVGFLFDGPGEPLPDKLEAFLAAGPPPLFLGFGSMPDPEPGRTTALLVEAVQQAGVRAVLQGGWAELGGGPLPENVLPIGPVSHTRLFPRVRAVVHHGGAGTSSAAARAGVPQIPVPHAADQFYWAHRLWLCGVSPGAVTRRRLKPQRLAALIRSLGDNELLSERASRLAREMRSREPDWAAAREALLR